jgi:hypothetical protein
MPFNEKMGVKPINDFSKYNKGKMVLKGGVMIDIRHWYYTREGF